MKVRLELKGEAPLLMHNAAGADPLNPLVKEMKKITSKRVKTDEDLEAIARLEYEVSLYHVEGLGPVVPGAMIERCLVVGGRITRAGKNVERGLFVLDNESPLIYRGPRSIEELWQDPSFRLMAPVTVSGRKVMRCRPMFREWAVEVNAEVDATVLNLQDLRGIADHAGTMAGLGDWRPRYGRFAATITPL
jgi:hypothetical protein